MYGIEKGTPHDKVIDLTDETFDDIVTTDPANGLWLLKFYAPWLVLKIGPIVVLYEIPDFFPARDCNLVVPYAF